MKYPKIKETDTGHSEWLAPVMDGYKMACCDCGLVHELDFQVVAITQVHKDGTWEHTKPLKNHRVLFRARRNERSTAQVRRHKKPRSKGAK